MSVLKDLLFGKKILKERISNLEKENGNLREENNDLKANIVLAAEKYSEVKEENGKLKLDRLRSMIRGVVN